MQHFLKQLSWTCSEFLANSPRFQERVDLNGGHRVIKQRKRPAVLNEPSIDALRGRSAHEDVANESSMGVDRVAGLIYLSDKSCMDSCASTRSNEPLKVSMQRTRGTSSVGLAKLVGELSSLGGNPLPDDREM